MTLFGVDVSKYQAPADWAAVRAAGIEFVIARASIGGKLDGTFKAHIAGARNAGLILGAYHWLYPGADGRAQADVFLGQLGGSPAGYVCVVDVEDKADHKNPTAFQAAGLHTTTMAELRAFVARWRERTQQPLIVYTGSWFWRGWLGNPKGSDIGPLWHSRYVSPRGRPHHELFASVPSTWWSQSFGGWAGPTIIQFTSGARVSGFDSLLDADAFRGTREELSAYTRGQHGATNLQEDPMATAVNANNRKLASDTVALVPAGTALFRDDRGTVALTTNRDLVLDEFGTPVGVAGFRYVLLGTATVDADAEQEMGLLLVRESAVANGLRAKTPAEMEATANRFAATDCNEAIRTATESLERTLAQVRDLVR